MKIEVILSIFCCNIIQCLSGEVYTLTSAKLTSFPSDIPPTTEEINLQDNEITNIPEGRLSGFTSLFRLYMPGNHLSEFPALCEVGHTLDNLTLHTNRITVVPQERISCLKVLTLIHLGYNRFTTMPDLSVLGPTLRYLYFNYNQRIENITTDIISKLMALEVLDLAFCNFDENQFLTLGMNSSVIRRLEIQDNNIRNFPEAILDKLDNLEVLLLGSNPYQVIPSLDQVKSTLRQLNFESYRMTNVPDEYLKGMNQLVRLVLRKCEIKTWPLTLDDVAATIEKIDLSQNQIPEFHVLKSMPKLNTLDVSFNSFTTIPENAFQEAPQLTHLYLVGNGLQTLYDLGTNVLQTLYLNGNQLVCDCRLAWLKILTETNDLIISDPAYYVVTCMKPVELLGREFKVVTKEMMCADSGTWYRNFDVMDSDNATTVDQLALTTDDCALLCLSCTECKSFDMKGQNLQCRLFVDDPNKCEKELSQYFMKNL